MGFFYALYFLDLCRVKHYVIILLSITLFLSCQSNQEVVIHIVIPDNGMELLNAYRENALEFGLIRPQDKKYVDATIINKNDSIPVRLRLKGDWPDHLNEEQWSFRLKSKQPIFKDSIRVFSIQRPETRFGLFELFMHQWARHEGILNTPYSIEYLNVNGVSNYYAIEGHFNNDLLKQQNRPIGPIFKLDEETVWSKFGMENKVNFQNIPFYKAAKIEVFQKGYFIRSNKVERLALLNTGYRKFRRLKLFDKNLAQIIDIDHAAKLHAMLNIMIGEHALNWHNQRWYYNPSSDRLEQVYSIVLVKNIQS